MPIRAYQVAAFAAAVPRQKKDTNSAARARSPEQLNMDLELELEDN